MKEYIGEDGIPVEEFELEDVESLLTSDLHFGLQQNSLGQKKRMVLPSNVREAVIAERDRVYWQDVKKKLHYLRKGHLDSRDLSPEPQLKTKREIDKWTFILTPEFSEPQFTCTLNEKELNIRKAWAAIVDGHRITVKALFRPWQYVAHYEAEAYYQYLQWLKTLQANPEPVTPLQGKEGSTGAKSKGELTQWQAAYLLAYQNAGIRDPRTDNERTADKIAKKLLAKYSPSTGGQLYTKFDKIRSKAKRQTVFNSVVDKYKGNPNKKAIRAILENVKTILPLLEGVQKSEAESDLKRWNRMYSSEIE
jgi:hypothetical protein